MQLVYIKPLTLGYPGVNPPTMTKWFLKNLLRKPNIVVPRRLLIAFVFDNISFLMLLVMLEKEFLLVGN